MINPQRLIRLTQQVVRINSENPPGREKELAAFIGQKMRVLGLAVKTYAFARNRPNVIVTLKGNFPRSRASHEALLITPHIDTVPAGKGWRENPFGGKIKNGKVFGRGASDDKGNLACCLEVMQSLAEDRVMLNRDVIMAATVDEETGSQYGIIPLLGKRILKPAYALVLDSDEFNTIISQKGLIHCRVQVYGKKAHGAYVWRGVNAIEQAAEIIRSIKNHKFKYQRHPLLRPPTINVGVIKGGDKVNMVADFCEFALDLRYLPGMKAQEILHDVRRIIQKTTQRFKILIDDIQQPYNINARDPFVKTYMTCSRNLGIHAKLRGSEGATVITFFKRHRIPAFASGFGAYGMAHTTDEFARIDTLVKGARLLESFIKHFDARTSERKK